MRSCSLKSRRPARPRFFGPEAVAAGKRNPRRCAKTLSWPALGRFAAVMLNQPCAYRKRRRPAGFGGKSVRWGWGRLAGRRGIADRFPSGWKMGVWEAFFLPGADAPRAQHGTRLGDAPCLPTPRACSDGAIRRPGGRPLPGWRAGVARAGGRSSWRTRCGCGDKHSFGPGRRAVKRLNGPMAEEPQAPSAWAFAVGLSNLTLRAKSVASKEKISVIP